MQRWTIALAEHEIRAIADGLQIEADGECAEIVHRHRREPAGAPLLIWGACDDDALTVRGLDDLVAALELLRLAALDEPACSGWGRRATISWSRRSGATTARSTCWSRPTATPLGDLAAEP